MKCFLSALALAAIFGSTVCGDEIDQVIGAAKSGNEQRLEQTMESVMQLPTINFNKVGAQVVELNGQHEAAASDPKKQQGLEMAIQALLTISVERGGDRELKTIVPKLIEAMDKGGAKTNQNIEVSLGKMLYHQFTEAEVRDAKIDAQNWGDRRKLWTSWWASNETKDKGQLLKQGLARAGIKFDLGDKGDAALVNFVQTMISALDHAQPHVRFAASHVFRAMLLHGIPGMEHWPYEADAPAGERNRAKTDLAKSFEANKAKFLANVRQHIK